MLKWKASLGHSTLSYCKTCEEFRWISWKFEQIPNLMKSVREDMRWLAIAREYGRVPHNSPLLFICCWNCTSHLRTTDSYSKAHDLVMYQHVLFSFRKFKEEFITIALLAFLFLSVLQSLRIIHWSLTHLTWRLISMVSFKKFSYIPIYKF